MAIAIPTAIAIGISMLVFGNFSDSPTVPNLGILPFLPFVLLPALAGALITKIVSGFAARQSNGNISAGPPVIGFAAAVPLPWLLVEVLQQYPFGYSLLRQYSGRIFLLTLVLAPFSAALAGTAVTRKLSPREVAAVIAVLAFIATILTFRSE